MEMMRPLLSSNTECAALYSAVLPEYAVHASGNHLILLARKFALRAPTNDGLQGQMKEWCSTGARAGGGGGGAARRRLTSCTVAEGLHAHGHIDSASKHERLPVVQRLQPRNAFLILLNEIRQPGLTALTSTLHLMCHDSGMRDSRAALISRINTDGNNCAQLNPLHVLILKTEVARGCMGRECRKQCRNATSLCECTSLQRTCVQRTCDC